MIVLGIDPGSRVTGWGLVEHSRGRYRHLASGVIRSDTSAEMEVRLDQIFSGLEAVLAEHKPDAVAIEAIFKHKSATSALVLGQARGVALLAAARAGFHPHEYNATSVKRTVGAHGAADKGAVARMVALLVGEPIPGPSDASDAVAIAITHCAHARAHLLTGRSP
ncbi:MAG: crossover junction endodeoxyribonuclease RuvC [Deltaproteobacteria bacterium]|nr:crossover junction endodeoxyribonuclease RuvC [Deltaproteobacteria bacterium]